MGYSVAGTPFANAIRRTSTDMDPILQERVPVKKVEMDLRGAKILLVDDTATHLDVLCQLPLDLCENEPIVTVSIR